MPGDCPPGEPGTRAIKLGRHGWVDISVASMNTGCIGCDYNLLPLNRCVERVRGSVSHSDDLHAAEWHKLGLSSVRAHLFDILICKLSDRQLCFYPTIYRGAPGGIFTICLKCSQSCHASVRKRQNSLAYQHPYVPGRCYGHQP